LAFLEQMKIVLVNLPVHIPTVMPYSLSMMRSVLLSELDADVIAIDLNADYHFMEFKDLYGRMADEDYFGLLDEFEGSTRLHYQKLSKAALAEGILPHYDELLRQILAHDPDAVPISMTYNSQVFLGKYIIRDLLAKGIKVIIGGPGDHSQIKNEAIALSSYSEMVDYLTDNGAKKHKEPRSIPIDYSIFDKKMYFSRDAVYPLRTSLSCPYRRCAFCTHHQNIKYHILDLGKIKEAIVFNKMKKVCFIDDDFALTHLENLADIVRPLGITWWCQLRPVKKLIPLLPKLYASGLRSVAWGVESGSQKILDRMDKGTELEDIEAVLAKSKDLGIFNMTYVMFGFPTETEEDVKTTIRFLRKNKKSIDLISPSTFGLQKGSRIFESPQEFGIKDITLVKRSLLGEKINYVPESGLNQDEAEKIKKRYLGELNNMNKVPKVINSCKEQILNYP
jgi:radical SAM superfamily enzyme YgiQ (UPF0313 family)